VAWIFYRPVWSVPILIVSVGSIVWLCFRTKNAMDNNPQGNGNYDSGNNKKEDGEEEIVVSMGRPTTNPSYKEGEDGGFANALDTPIKY